MNKEHHKPKHEEKKHHGPDCAPVSDGPLSPADETSDGTADGGSGNDTHPPKDNPPPPPEEQQV